MSGGERGGEQGGTSCGGSGLRRGLSGGDPPEPPPRPAGLRVRSAARALCCTHPPQLTFAFPLAFARSRSLALARSLAGRYDKLLADAKAAAAANQKELS